MAAVPSGTTPGVGGMCTDFDTNAAELNSALENAEILTNGVLTLTQIDGSTFTNNIPYFADFVISGLNLNISNVPVNRTLTYTAGTYQINAQVYSIPVGSNFQLTAGHPTLPRIDILYLTNTNNIIYQTGVPSVNPVQPAPPAGTLLLAAIGVQINATTSLNYTLVTVNTNSSTIVPPTLTPGTISGSHLFWDGLTWVENTFWNVSNSSFEPTARIHTYTDTDASGFLTTAILGDAGIDRGFLFNIDDTLNGFRGSMLLSGSNGTDAYFTVNTQDNNLGLTTSILMNTSSFQTTNEDFTNNFSTRIQQFSSDNIFSASTAVFDPANYTRITQNINQILFESETGSSNSTFNFNSNFTLLEVSDGMLTNSTGITNIDINNKIFQDLTNNNNFTQTLTTTDSLITQGTNISSFGQDLSTLKNTLNITDGAVISCTLTQNAGSGINTFGVANGSFNSYIEQKVIGLSQANTINLNDNTLQLKFIQDLDFNIQSLSIENTVSNTNTIYIQEINNHFLTTDVNYLLTGSSRSVLDMYDSIAYFYNRNQPLTKNSEIQLNHTAGILIKYEDTVAPTNDVSLTLFNGRVNINGGIEKNQRNTAIATAILDDDWMIVSTAALTVTLPAAPTDGRELVLKSRVGTMTINLNGKTMDSVATVTAGNARTIIFNTALNIWLNI